MSRLVVSLLLVTWLANTALAQTQLRSPSLPYLQRLAWSAEERGSLIVVAPDRPLPFFNSFRSPRLNELAREGGVNVLDVAAVLERKLVHTGSMSVLVPETMRVLNTKLGKPDPSQLPQFEAILALAASLDERQWTLLGGSSGLSRADLTPDQQPLFTSLLPPLRNENGPIPPEAIAQGQLHVHQHTQFFFAYQNEHLNTSTGGAFNGNVARKDGDVTLQRDYPPALQRNHTKYGVPLTPELPNRLKPSQLDYKSAQLNRPVMLEGAQSLGELIARAAKATGLELRADKRLAELPLWLRNTPEQTVRAGDLLETLALSVTGAFRKLDAPGAKPLWLLTDDIEGLATRQRRQALWVDAQSLAGGIRSSTAMQTLQALNPVRFIRYDNAYGFPPETVSNILKKGTGTPTVLPLSALPSSVAAQLAPLIQQEHAAMRGGQSRREVDGVVNPPLDLDRIKLGLQAAAVSLEVPGYGVYRDENLGHILSWPLEWAARRAPEPVPVRPSLDTRLAIVFPKTSEEARQAVAAAAAAHLSALWIATQSDALKPLQAALAAGKDAHLPIAALVRLTQEPQEAPPDINLLGEPGPYRLPDSPETTTLLLPRLQALVALPGLAALVLDKTAAPGYEHEFNSTTSGWGRSNEPLAYGYTPLQRLRFARTEGFDPIDLSYNDGPGFFLSPNNWVGTSPLPRPTNPMQRWSDLRFDANKALLKQVFTALKTAAPTLPLWIKERQAGENHRSWFGSWDKAEALPIFEERFAKPTLDPDQQARAFSQRVLFTYPMPAVADAENFLTSLLSNEVRPDKPFAWDGLVLDLQALPIEKALAILKESKL